MTDHICRKRTKHLERPYTEGQDYILVPRYKGAERYYLCTTCGQPIGL